MTRTPRNTSIITNAEVNPRSRYRNVGYNVNHNLRSLATMIGVNIPLTMYVTRHGWASAAKAQGVPVSVISEGRSCPSKLWPIAL